MNSIKQIFEDKPQQWGLRGDPYLWDNLEANLGHLNTELTAMEFGAILNKEFREIVERDGGKKTGNTVWFAQFPQDGMSGGGVSIDWWTEIGMPLLKSRYEELKNRIEWIFTPGDRLC